MKIVICSFLLLSWDKVLSSSVSLTTCSGLFRSLIPYFVEMSERDSHFADLKVENCELSCNGVSQLVGVLSTLKRPLDSLSIGENGLGSKVGAPLGNFLGIGIQALEIEDIGRSSGFLELQKEIGEDLKLAYINMRFY
ncbi:hypothetical protein ACSBR2_002390 [Camellia fascicularis]